MSKKLGLDRDFTRFINDPTFPYKVTVCIGEERILCSGVLLAQQSNVLEKKFREDDGVLMFEEMLDVKNSHRVLHECIGYLHGKNLSFSMDNVAVTLKFASFYRIEDLFKKGMVWLKQNLNSSKSVKSVKVVVELLKLSNALDSNDSARLKSMIASFVKDNKNIVGNQIGEFLKSGVTGFDMALIVEQEPSNCGDILKKWCSIAIENQKFILENHSLFDFKMIFPCAEEFSAFVSRISGKSQSVDAMKALLELQKLYFTGQKSESNDDKSLKNVPQKVPSPKPGTSSKQLSASANNATSKGRNPFVASPQKASVTPAVNPFPSKTQPPREKQPQFNNAFQAKLPGSKVMMPNVNYCSYNATPWLYDQNHPGPSPDLEESEHDSKDVFVDNVPSWVTYGRLIQIFKFAGWIEHVTIRRETGSANIRFKNEESVNKLLNSGSYFPCDDVELYVEPYDSSTGNSSMEENTTVYVGNLSKNTRELGLKSLLGGFGKISRITIIERRDYFTNFAFLEYDSVGSALAVVRAGKSRDIVTEGRVLKIEMKRNN